jgi:outer membrane protein TolC
MNQAALDYQASVIGREKAEKQIAAAVKKFYYQLIVQREAIELTRARLANARERLRQAQVSYELGQGTELNFMYATANVEGLVPELRSMETARVLAVTKFQEILGFDSREDMELSGTLAEATAQSVETVKTGGARFDVNEANLTVKQLRSALSIQNMTLLPNLILQYKMDPTINGPELDTLFDKDNWHQSSGGLYLTLSWDVTGFIPGSDCQIKRAALKDQLSLAAESARTSATNAFHDEQNQKRLIQDSLAKIENLKTVVDATKRSYELVDASYKAGVGRYLDLQSAEISWQGTQIQLLNEQLNLMSLVYDLEAKYAGN